MSYKSVPQDWLARVSHKSVAQECVLQECRARVSYKNVAQDPPSLSIGLLIGLGAYVCTHKRPTPTAAEVMIPTAGGIEEDHAG